MSENDVPKTGLPKTDLETVAPKPVDLREMTEARVLIGRFGAGQPTRAVQSFLLDHARAREAVWSEVDWKSLETSLIDLQLGSVAVESQAADRSIYVRRPDLGRKLAQRSAEYLANAGSGCDVAIIVADGLSASAIHTNAAALIRALAKHLLAQKRSLSPVVFASLARVALGDPIAEIMRARVSIVLVGERPGLSAADSLGAYITYAPASGTPDSRRNCISNIRDGGLSIEMAAEAIVGLVSDMLTTGISGVGLKDALAALPGKER